MLTPYYIYRHIRPDTNQVFYVGKGRNRRGRYLYERSKSKDRRNKYWWNIVRKNKGEYIVEIVAEFETQESCDAKEIEFIALYGRSNLKGGTLCNLTDGGDGSTNIVHSEETKAKLRAAVADGKHPNFGKKLSAETCRKKSEAVKGEKHHLYGKTLPKEWVRNLAKGKLGEKNPWFGKPSPVSKKVKNTRTGAVYDSIARAAKAEGIKPGKLYSILDGHTKTNTTDLVRI